MMLNWFPCILRLVIFRCYDLYVLFFISLYLYEIIVISWFRYLVQIVSQFVFGSYLGYKDPWYHCLMDFLRLYFVILLESLLLGFAFNNLIVQRKNAH